MLHKEIRENGLVADLFTGPFAGSRKAIILLGGSEGGKSWGRVRKPLELLVELGYALLSLAYFKADGLPAALQEIPLEYFANAFSWLAAQEDIVTDQYALLGGSKGAEAALLLGSRYPQVKR